MELQCRWYPCRSSIVCINAIYTEVHDVAKFIGEILFDLVANFYWWIKLKGRQSGIVLLILFRQCWWERNVRKYKHNSRWRWLFEGVGFSEVSFWSDFDLPHACGYHSSKSRNEGDVIDDLTVTVECGITVTRINEEFVLLVAAFWVFGIFRIGLHCSFANKGKRKEPERTYCIHIFVIGHHQ